MRKRYPNGGFKWCGDAVCVEDNLNNKKKLTAHISTVKWFYTWASKYICS